MSKATDAMRQANLKHGAALVGRFTPEYRAWASMKDRCYNTKDEAYKNYGGRGIHVCSEWLHNFPAFLAHVGARPSALHTIDRRDNNGHYEPGNVRWATRLEQSRNRRNIRQLVVNGQVRPIWKWAEMSGTPINLICQRIRDLNWTPEKAVWEPRRSEQKYCRRGHLRTGTRCIHCKRLTDAAYRKALA